jgi:hypothetical protein
MIECDEKNCVSQAAFLVFAHGYPAPQTRSCTGHLGLLIADDMVNPGSTRRWDVHATKDSA